MSDIGFNVSEAKHPPTDCVVTYGVCWINPMNSETRQAQRVYRVSWSFEGGFASYLEENNYGNCYYKDFEKDEDGEKFAIWLMEQISRGYEKVVNKAATDESGFFPRPHKSNFK